MHAHPLLKTPNASSGYQINLLRVLLFMHNSSSRIFLHQFQTIKHKYAIRYSRNNFKEPKKERLIIPSIVFMSVIRLSGTVFQMKAKKNTIAVFF